MLIATPRRAHPHCRPSNRAHWQGTALALLLASAGVLAQPASKAAKPASQATTKVQASAAKAGKAAKPATARQKLKSEASSLALATETAETINELQLAIAARVLTGSADCEFNQRISVVPLAGKDGFFTVTYFTTPQKSLRYTMAPRETATGAVRLEDKAAGVVWLQIPTKSMLMNTRAGQRMVDSCLHAEQRIAVAAATAAGTAPGQGIGIVAQVPAMATTTAAAQAVVAPAVVTPAVVTPATTTPGAATAVVALPADAVAAAAASEAVEPAAAAVALPALPGSTVPVPVPVPMPMPAAAPPAAADNTAAPLLPTAATR